ncbi:peptidyl-tRNA hydrolase (macronuclear) [Tetrahymena thermophila SB210]|uniref:Peptidyl-tRNA hydrolase n=1 Tax=Tetrahymena thermophila (strain SB210) TaxID=312017 RepID=Q240P4_TETTS|nr:peptidyl-tRNA hydrolase [Tetrahymena thermophila SB210]EAS02370.1 peptidyl-tRNA hydrolase [Tetrahymena thermophila SB210]|eukprot:XP_001022615.1 peptidyl-tRNA hydrolase [Tetrahymena thermophila SB210]
MKYLIRSFSFKQFYQQQFFAFSKRPKQLDIDTIIESHKSKVGLEDELKKYENNLKIDQIQLNLKDIQIPKEHLEIRYSKSSGAGGQHINKTNSKAEIRFNIDTAKWIEDDVKKRLKSQYQQHINQDNYLILQCQTGRDQDSNLREAIEKLRQIIWECSLPEKERLNLIPAETKDLQKKRIDVKRKKSEVKSTRSIR